MISCMKLPHQAYKALLECAALLHIMYITTEKYFYHTLKPLQRALHLQRSTIFQ